MSTFYCFNGMKSIVENFNKGDIVDYIKNENNDIKNMHMYIKLFIDAIKCLNSIDFKFELFEKKMF